MAESPDFVLRSTTIFNNMVEKLRVTLPDPVGGQVAEEMEQLRDSTVTAMTEVMRVKWEKKQVPPARVTLQIPSLIPEEHLWGGTAKPESEPLEVQLTKAPIGTQVKLSGYLAAAGRPSADVLFEKTGANQWTVEAHTDPAFIGKMGRTDLVLQGAQTSQSTEITRVGKADIPRSAVTNLPTSVVTNQLHLQQWAALKEGKRLSLRKTLWDQMAQTFAKAPEMARVMVTPPRKGDEYDVIVMIAPEIPALPSGLSIRTPVGRGWAKQEVEDLSVGLIAWAQLSEHPAEILPIVVQSREPALTAVWLAGPLKGHTVAWAHIGGLYRPIEWVASPWGNRGSVPTARNLDLGGTPLPPPNGKLPPRTGPFILTLDANPSNTNPKVDRSLPYATIPVDTLEEASDTLLGWMAKEGLDASNFTPRTGTVITSLDRNPVARIKADGKAWVYSPDPDQVTTEYDFHAVWEPGARVIYENDWKTAEGTWHTVRNEAEIISVPDQSCVQVRITKSDNPLVSPGMVLTAGYCAPDEVPDHGRGRVLAFLGEAGEQIAPAPMPPPPAAPVGPPPPGSARALGVVLKRVDRKTGTIWLEFPGKPSFEVRNALKHAGFRWSGWRKQWHANKGHWVPSNIATQDAGMVDYAEERAEDKTEGVPDRVERLEEKAARLAEQAERAEEKAHSIADNIPLGQPILVGHHSEARARHDQDTIQRNFEKAHELRQEAEKLAAQAEASRKHQERTEQALEDAKNVGLEFDANLEVGQQVEARWTANYEANRDPGVVTKVNAKTVHVELAPERTVILPRMGNPTWSANNCAAPQGHPEYPTALKQEPDIVDKLGVQAGDIVKIRGSATRVDRVNEKSISGTDLRTGFNLKWQRSEVQEIIKKVQQGQTVVEKAPEKIPNLKLLVKVLDGVVAASGVTNATMLSDSGLAYATVLDMVNRLIALGLVDRVEAKDRDADGYPPLGQLSTSDAYSKATKWNREGGMGYKGAEDVIREAWEKNWQRVGEKAQTGQTFEYGGSVFTTTLERYTEGQARLQVERAKEKAATVRDLAAKRESLRRPENIAEAFRLAARNARQAASMLSESPLSRMQGESDLEPGGLVREFRADADTLDKEAADWDIKAAQQKHEAASPFVDKYTAQQAFMQVERAKGFFSTAMQWAASTEDKDHPEHVAQMYRQAADESRKAAVMLMESPSRALNGESREFNRQGGLVAEHEHIAEVADEKAAQFQAKFDAKHAPQTPETVSANQPKSRKVDPDVIEVLANSKMDGPLLVLPQALDRKLYLRVNDVLEAVGGKWNKQKKGHLFPEPAEDVIAPILLTGHVSFPSDMGFFPTPVTLAEYVIARADIQQGMYVLEPSAGQGILARLAKEKGGKVDCIELDEKRYQQLANSGVCAVPKQADFLALEPSPVYDRIVMNPPFAKSQDVKHVLHALQFLRPGGRLVAIMSAGVMYRTTALYEEFRRIIESWDGKIEDLPEDAFKESGTNVRTVLVQVRKPV